MPLNNDVKNKIKIFEKESKEKNRKEKDKTIVKKLKMILFE